MQSPATSKTSRLPLPFTPEREAQAEQKRPPTSGSRIAVPQRPTFTKDFSIGPPCRQLPETGQLKKHKASVNGNHLRAKSVANLQEQEIRSPSRRTTLYSPGEAHSEFEELRNCFADLSTTVARQDVQIHHLIGEIAHLRTELHIQRATETYIQEELNNAGRAR
jgi:hypothetical protein